MSNDERGLIFFDRLSLSLSLTSSFLYPSSMRIFNGQGDTSVSSMTSAVEVYDGSSWGMLSSGLSLARSGMSCVSFKGCLVVMGGLRMGNRLAVDTVEVYDPLLYTWFQNTSYPKLTSEQSSSGVVAF